MATSQQLDDIDPTSAQTPEAFMQLLREARGASGLSIVEVAERARKRGYDLDPVSLALAIESPTLPPWQTVTGLLVACGMGGMQIDRWMRVFHDLAAPAQPILADAPPVAVDEPADLEPVSVPPLLLSTAPATSPRLTRRHYAIAAGVLAAMFLTPLLLFAVLNDDPSNVAAEATSPAPRTNVIAPPAPLPADSPAVDASPTEGAVPTSPAAAPSTTKPPPRTTAPPPPPPPPSPPPPSPNPPAEPPVLRTGVAELTDSSHRFDLDSGQANGERNDIFRVDGQTLGRLNGSRLKSMSGMPGKQTCQEATGWENSVDNLQAGQWLCVETSGHRFARLNVTAIGGTLRLAYTVWT